MALNEFVIKRSGFQPVRQPLFAPARPGCGQQFEQTGAPEQIKIGGIGVMRIGETRPILSTALPAIFEARDPAFKETYGAPGMLGLALDSRLPPDQDYEYRDRRGDPPDRNTVERIPDDGCDAKEDE